MDMHSIHIDFDKRILEINGKPYTKKTVVDLPAPDGWERRMLFNGDISNAEEAYDRITVKYTPCDQQ